MVPVNAHGRRILSKIAVSSRVTLRGTSQGWPREYLVWIVREIRGHLFELIPAAAHPPGTFYLAVLPDIAQILPDDCVEWMP